VRDLRPFLDDPVGVSTLTADERAALTVKVALLASALASCQALAPAPKDPPATDRLLKVAEVAKRFGRSVDWVYRKATTDPAWRAFTRREGRRTTRFSEAGLARYLGRPRA